MFRSMIFGCVGFRNFSKSSFLVYVCGASRDVVCILTTSWPALPSSGREVQEGSAQSAAETRGIVSRKSRGEDLSVRSAVHPRYDLWASRS